MKKLATTTRSTVRRTVATARDVSHRVLATAGATQSESKISLDSQSYSADASGSRWLCDSHWREAQVFDGTDLWSEIGRRHLEMLDRGARMLQADHSWNRVLDWGCGGGANAVHLAPRCRELVAVDPSAASLDECARQVGAVSGTALRPVLIDVAEPERALDVISDPVDVFVSFYVFELIPTPEYGERILRIARQLLAPGGLALIQIKYDEGRWRTRPRRRYYRSGLAEMTTYTIASFWDRTQRCGLTPQSVELVPKNELDERYAYFLLSKPS